MTRRARVVRLIVGGSLLMSSAWLAAAEQLIPGRLRGQIAYVRMTDGLWQVWLSDVSTGTASQVTTSSNDKRYPTWGSNGRLLFRTNNDELYSIRIDGSDEQPFAKSLWPAVDAVSAPGGYQVVVARLRTDESDASNLWLMGPSGEHPRRLTNALGIQFNPSWSPDGQRVVYAGGKRGETFELFLVGADGTREQRLTENRHHDVLPAWSPDGRWIAYSADATGDYEIWLMAADGSTSQQLTKSPGLDSRPAWSPDGHHLAFATNRRGRLEIWVMNRDGSQQRPLIVAETEIADPAWR